jgi:hypothetical protein
MSEVFDKEYDCPTAVKYDGVKVYHMKGENAGSCASCDRYIDKLEREERKARGY